ncbi:MAG: hypothetical protein IT363_08130 [Methanoregulaceae archaeon]|nr:hypothetical protein [Methanoregulaceae archaeon]
MSFLRISRAGRSVLIGTVAAALLLAGLWAAQRPTVDPKMIGIWQGEMYPETILVLRDDGTFVSQSHEVNMRGHLNVRIRSEGKWRYAKDVIYFEAISIEATRGGQPFPEYSELFGGKLGKTNTMRIRWIDEDRFGVEAAMGYFARRTPEQVRQAQLKTSGAHPD